jgi:hypothetical protein
VRPLHGRSSGAAGRGATREPDARARDLRSPAKRPTNVYIYIYIYILIIWFVNNEPELSSSQLNDRQHAMSRRLDREQATSESCS